MRSFAGRFWPDAKSALTLLPPRASLVLALAPVPWSGLWAARPLFVVFSLRCSVLVRAGSRCSACCHSWLKAVSAFVRTSFGSLVNSGLPEKGFEKFLPAQTPCAKLAKV